MVFQIGSLHDFPEQNETFDRLSGANAFLRNENKPWACLSPNELAEVPLHSVHIMTDQNPTLLCGFSQNDGIIKALQRNRFRPLEVKARCVAQRPHYDGVFEICIGLKPDFHACFVNKRFLASSI